MKNKKSSLLIIAVVVIIAAVIFGSSTFIVIQPGEKGVIFRPWGSGLDKENVYSAGIHIVAPWNTMFVYDVKEQSLEFSKENTAAFKTLDVLDKNGLSIEAEVTVRFYPTFDNIGNLHEEFGVNYVRKLVIPEVRSSVRKVMGRYTAEQIYSTHRKEVEDAIIHETAEVLKNNNIEMTALLVRSIILPLDIKQAIENKLKQEQEALAYQYILAKEESEAKRKKIEAEGIAQYNRILNASLTNNILTQKGIDATLELANSSNTKIIVIGDSQKGGLPLIMGGK